MGPGKTKLFWYNHLPHWEIAGGAYFMTIRCAGSLPTPVLKQLDALHRQISAQRTQADNPALLNLQRRSFLALEKYLDQGRGFCPFRDPRCAKLIVAALEELEAVGWSVKNHVLMPNHIHLLVDTQLDAAPMKTVWTRWKGSTARRANLLLGRCGPFWHRDWFDRWMRDTSMRERTVRYIRHNPVKAGLVDSWEAYPWVC